MATAGTNASTAPSGTETPSAWIAHHTAATTDAWYATAAMITLVVSLLGAPLFAVGHRHRRDEPGETAEDARAVPPDVAVAGPRPNSKTEPSPTAAP